MQILVLIGLYFLKCTKFDQLILRKIIKIVATLTLKCAKIDFGWGSAPDPAGGAYSAPPDSLAAFKGPTSKRRGREGRWGRGGGARPVCLLVLTMLATGLYLTQTAQVPKLLDCAKNINENFNPLG